MRQYEMTYLVSDKVNDNDLTAATGKINSIITNQGGKILGEDNWGRRKLAYPIMKQEFATYITLNFSISPKKLSPVTTGLKLSKEIIRYLLVVKDYGKEELKLTSDEIAETDEIEEVVGGEKSFEAIEGETEESYDLMAKRDEEPQEEDQETIQEKETVQVEAVKEDTKDETKDTKKSKEDTENKPAPKKSVKKDGEVKKTKVKDKAKSEAENEKDKKAEEEADRLAKLDEEIEGILGDDL